MINIPEAIKYNLIYKNGNDNYIYADYTGSGQHSPIIDDYLKKYIYSNYANTHSNSLWSKMMTTRINNCKKYLRKIFNILNDQSIIFTGQGTTGAINHLVNSIDFSNQSKINIIISLYEHHSNFLPWIEKSKLYPNMELYIIPLSKEGDIDYIWYENLLKKLNTNDLTITSITACSNVSGIIIDIHKIKSIIQNQFQNRSLLFVDYACSAPYKKIDASIFDACFISPHKFIGGTSTPGILIAKNSLFTKKCPYAPGGGCVKVANDIKILYDNNIETREMGGTPNIIGIIRIHLIFVLKQLYFNIIEKNETFIVNYVHHKLKILSNKLPNLTVLYLNKSLNHRLPIVCISIDNCHYNTIVEIMSSLFGIQTRGGISCCGLFARYIKNTMNINGWCRITFHWLMTIYEINYILNAIEYIALNHKSYKNNYFN
mgnify:FL=1|jgi:selenocysteine lyase/cysteine desulfurase